MAFKPDLPASLKFLFFKLPMVALKFFRVILARPSVFLSRVPSPGFLLSRITESLAPLPPNLPPSLAAAAPFPPDPRRLIPERSAWPPLAMAIPTVWL